MGNSGKDTIRHRRGDNVLDMTEIINYGIYDDGRENRHGP